MSVIQQFKSKASIADLCCWSLLPRSVYYYRPTHGRKGVPPSVTTPRMDGKVVGNDEVVEDIRTILSGEFVCYGYQNVTMDLKDMGYIINHKKVYRLMDENHLLLGKVIRTSGKRNFVRFRRIEATHPMEYLCWDIKYVWVEGDRKNYYLLSLMDVYTRRILAWVFQGSIRKVDLLKIIRRVDLSHPLKGVTLRNDNGSQFIANKVRHYLNTLDVYQEFTHIATPQENSYIESFHSNFEREVVKRFEFNSYYDAKTTISAYMDHYNNKRRHSALKRVTPMAKWNEYFSSISADMSKTAKGSEEISTVDIISTEIDLGVDKENAIFAQQMRKEFINKYNL